MKKKWVHSSGNGRLIDQFSGKAYLLDTSQQRNAFLLVGQIVQIAFILNKDLLYNIYKTLLQL